MNWIKNNILSCISFALVIVTITIVLVASNYQKHKYGKQQATTRELTLGAISVAIAFILSFFGYTLPQGGTITPASVLPIMLYCHYFGLKKGSIVCICFTLLQFMQNPFLLTPFQVILDYFLPYFALIFTAIIPFNRDKYSMLKNENKNTMPAHLGYIIGSVFYVVVRYVSHVLSGAIFFGEYAWDGWQAWPYSIVYNSFSIVDSAIAITIGIILFANKAFDTFMAKTLYANQKTDCATKDDKRTTPSTNEWQR